MVITDVRALLFPTNVPVSNPRLHHELGSFLACEPQVMSKAASHEPAIKTAHFSRSRFPRFVKLAS